MGRHLPADIASRPSSTDGTDRRPPNMIGSPDPELVWTSLLPPTPRAGLIPREGLQSLLQAGLGGKLCLLDAPAGYGKTTLLAQWSATAGAGRVAWVSLDKGHNDPTRFWISVAEAVRTVEPHVGAAALQALQRPSADLDRVVLPSLLNDLSECDSPLVLVLDDYYLVTAATCHQTLSVFLDYLPVGVHVMLATRVDPPLPLARMRARGELTELRVADLRFTDEEAFALLNAAMGLRLAADEVERLVERTEGWAAGLYLAGMSLRGRQDPAGFIAAFHGDNRHVADYLAADVLARQPEEITRFLLRTSVLRRLSGPLCDAVLEAEGSTGILGELERSNLFLVPLDDHREWYRYHQLFGELLRLELGNREAAVIPGLHRRATAWHRSAGDVEAQGISADPLCGIVHMALGRALIRQARFTEAQEQLESALELFGIDGMAVHRAHVLLLLATMDHGRGDLPGARTLLQRAHELIEQMADPGVLPALLQRSRQLLGSAPRRRVETTAPLTRRELAVLCLLPTELSTREISYELRVSVNTVRSQVRAVYRKLEATSRTEAVTRARELGLIPVGHEPVAIFT
jgi:ATP/maltotriose-dependent transcriptional regulator MalT